MAAPDLQSVIDEIEAKLAAVEQAREAAERHLAELTAAAAEAPRPEQLAALEAVLRRLDALAASPSPQPPPA